MFPADFDEESKIWNSFGRIFEWEMNNVSDEAEAVFKTNVYSI